jgi:hypothetical protein
VDWSLYDLFALVCGLGAVLAGLAMAIHGLTLLRSVVPTERTVQWLDKWLRSTRVLADERSRGMPLPADLLDGARRVRGIQLLFFGIALMAFGITLAAETVRIAPADPLEDGGLWTAGFTCLAYFAGTVGLVTSLALLARSGGAGAPRIPPTVRSSRGQTVAFASALSLCLVLAAVAQYFPSTRPGLVEPLPSPWLRWLPLVLLLPMPLWCAIIVRWFGRIDPRALTEDAELAPRTDADLRESLMRWVYLMRGGCMFGVLQSQFLAVIGVVNDLVMFVYFPVMFFVMFSGIIEPTSNQSTGVQAV